MVFVKVLLEAAAILEEEEEDLPAGQGPERSCAVQTRKDLIAFSFSTFMKTFTHVLVAVPILGWSVG